MSDKEVMAGDLTDLISGVAAEIKVFHDVKIPTYLVQIPLSRIHFWKENARTLLDFDILEKEEKKSVDEIDDGVILRFLSRDRKRLKLQPLMKSIESNGLKVPIIISTSGILLDGNRRFFACKLLERIAMAKDKVEKIPAYIIKDKDIDSESKCKILAEANFVDDCKVDWPLDVKAKVVSDHVARLAGDDPTPSQNERAVGQVANIYGISRQTVRDYIAAKELSDRFFESVKDKNNEKYEEMLFKRRDIVNKRFVYFWEFVNKGMRGREPIVGSDLESAINSFFILLDKEAVRNIKHVEAIARASTVGLTDELKLVVMSAKESDVEELHLLYQDSKKIRDKEKKVRTFRVWVQTLKREEIDDAIKSELAFLEKLISRKLEGL